jgi:hypothetical protein
LNLPQQLDVALDAAPLPWEALEQAVAKALDPLGHPKVEVGVDQGVVPVRVHLLELDLRHSGGSQDARNHSVGVAATDVVEPDVELVAAAFEDSGVATGDRVSIENQDLFAVAREQGGRGETAGAGPDHYHVVSVVFEGVEAIGGHSELVACSPDSAACSSRP